MPLSDTNLMAMMEQLVIRCEAAESLRDKAEKRCKEVEIRCDNAEHQCSINEMRNLRYRKIMKLLGFSSILLLTVMVIQDNKDRKKA